MAPSYQGLNSKAKSLHGVMVAIDNHVNRPPCEWTQKAQNHLQKLHAKRVTIHTEMLTGKY
ncbi:MAG: hypothetical protein DRH90_17690 [Deltaproteobacteria bacterium]|nr:MAG: hypothetical protein DRH90_17690 [Deltaproteobacteria bacterium]RLC12889.1 MAG: hypothetical protein DRI24_16840 [Deltaproteobacteria bacterium]